jgi:hypothetical protein
MGKSQLSVVLEALQDLKENYQDGPVSDQTEVHHTVIIIEDLIDSLTLLMAERLSWFLTQMPEDRL